MIALTSEVGSIYQLVVSAKRGFLLRSSSSVMFVGMALLCRIGRQNVCWCFVTLEFHVFLNMVHCGSKPQMIRRNDKTAPVSFQLSCYLATYIDWSELVRTYRSKRTDQCLRRDPLKRKEVA